MGLEIAQSNAAYLLDVGVALKPHSFEYGNDVDVGDLDLGDVDLDVGDVDVGNVDVGDVDVGDVDVGDVDVDVDVGDADVDVGGIDKDELEEDVDDIDAGIKEGDQEDIVETPEMQDQDTQDQDIDTTEEGIDTKQTEQRDNEESKVAKQTKPKTLKTNMLLSYLHSWLTYFHIPYLHYSSPRALTMYERAADQGNVEARLRIGDYYYYQDQAAEAARHYRAASDLKDPQATFNLGFQHHHGLGLPKDLNLAKRFYDLAQEHSPDARVAVGLALAHLWVDRCWAVVFDGERDQELHPFVRWLAGQEDVEGVEEGQGDPLDFWNVDLEQDTLVIGLVAGLLGVVVYLRYQA